MFTRIWVWLKTKIKDSKSFTRKKGTGNQFLKILSS